MKLSAVIIAKNEENKIKDAISSVKFADEVIVVDGGSEDKTVEVAQRGGAKISIYQTDDFSQMRNVGLEKAGGEWVLYVDADEQISSSLRDEIKSEIRNPKSEIVAYRVRRKNFYFGEHEWPYIEKLERLFRRESLRGWKGKLHETPIVEGKVGELSGFLLHYTHRDLTSMVNKTIEWSKIEAELRFKAGHPKMIWWRFPRVMLFAFFDSYLRQGGWKAGTAGLVESMYQAFSIFITYAKLWELQLKEAKLPKNEK